MIQLPPPSFAPTSHIIQAFLYPIHHLSRDLWPVVHWTLHVVLLQLVFFPVVRVHHQLSFAIFPYYHVSPQDTAELAQEAKRVVQEMFGSDVDYQD